MNHMTRDNKTPFDDEIEYKECPICFGTGERFESTDEEGIKGTVIPCPNCKGEGEVPRNDGYDRLTDELDNQADNAQEDNYFLDQEF